MKRLQNVLVTQFREIAEPARAVGAQAYMKSEMPFLGVAANPLRAVCKRVFDDHPIASAEEWRRTVLSLWRNARYREERYAAIELTGVRRYRVWQSLDALPMYEEMIVTGAWWDYVDAIAIHRVGEFLLRDHPKEMKRILRRWSRDVDLWKRRTAILSQIAFRGGTDAKFLFDCIEPSLASREFFLRKAIGWALRQYARYAPDVVREYVDGKGDRLSPLSRREAMKHLSG